jgi:uncharacterized protein (TIRG00374 family)
VHPRLASMADPPKQELGAHPTHLDSAKVPTDDPADVVANSPHSDQTPIGTARSLLDAALGDPPPEGWSDTIPLTTRPTPAGDATVDAAGRTTAVPAEPRPRPKVTVAPPDPDSPPATRVDPPGWFDGVQIIDTPTRRVHHPSDLVSIALALMGIALFFFLAVYAHGTTTGVSSDVRAVGEALRSLLFVPVSAMVTLSTVIMPLAVVVELAVQRLGRQIVEAIAAALTGFGLGYLAQWGLTLLEPDLSVGFMVWSGGKLAVVLPFWASSVVGLLTVAGPRSRRRTVRWSWNVLWITLAAMFLFRHVTLPGAAITMLLGVIAGHLVRWVSGVQSERAYGLELVEGIRRAGFNPTRLVRVHDVAEEDVAAASPSMSDATMDELSDPAALALTRFSDNRVYAMTTPEEGRLDLVVHDGDRQVVGVLTRFWRSLRLRGIEGRAVVSLRQVAERAALMSMSAEKSGVRTPELLAIAEAQDSMLLIQRHATGAVPIRDVPDSQLTDETLDAVWRQIKIAHEAGLAHRSLTDDVVLLGPATLGAADDGTRRYYGDQTTRPVGEREVWLTGWEYGDVASSTLAQRMDIVALVTLLALRVGADRAVASAERVLGADTVTGVGPLIQVPALPGSTREGVRSNKEIINELRQEILALSPEANVAPQPIVRIGAKNVLTWAFALIAVIIIVTTLNFNEIMAAIRTADPRWVAAAFGLGLITFLGSAIALVAFAPLRLGLWRTTLVQVAGAFVALVAPAGVGPAALNLRMLTKRNVAMPLAVASVSLVQVSQFVTTVLLLIVLGFFGGGGAFITTLPSTTVLLAALGVAVVIAAMMLVPKIRAWVVAKAEPVLKQTWPRLVQILSQPRRLALATVGNLIMTLGYIMAFQACLLAFDREMALIDIAIIYLVGNAAGAAAPTPGGLGAIELAFIGQLTAAGLGAGLATSVAMLFRFLTYWCRIPIGWLAMRHLQKRGEL